MPRCKKRNSRAKCNMKRKCKKLKGRSKKQSTYQCFLRRCGYLQKGKGLCLPKKGSKGYATFKKKWASFKKSPAKVK